MRKFKALESLRFFAAISVALLHIFGIYGKGNLIPYSFILSVDFFFVLSGFVITYKESKNKNSLDYTKEFVYGTVIRLLIPYMLIILFYYLFFNMKSNIYLIIIYLICIMLGSFLFYKNIEKFIIKFKYDVKNEH